MADIHAVLLIPAEDDPHGLLAEGPCGARPPIWTDELMDALTGEFYVRRQALVLAWGGQVLSESLDRAARIASRAEEGPLNERAWGRNPALVEDIVDLVPYFELLARRLGCTLLRLDSEGREVPHG